MKRTMAFWAALALGIPAPGSAGQGEFVIVVPVEGPIALESARVMQQAIKAAEEDGIGAVVFDIASRTGRLDHVQLVAESMEETAVSVFAFVRERAWDGTALLVLAADSVFVAPGASIGAGDEAWEMTPAALDAARDAFRAAALRHGRDSRVAEAMVDPEVSVPGVSPGGERLRVGAEAAVRLGLAVQRAPDVAAVLGVLGLGDAEIITAETAWTTTTVSITNRNWNNVRVFVQRSGSRVRLGTVTSHKTVDFEVTPAQLGGSGYVRVVVEVIGSFERIATEEVRIQPGLVIEWTIENALQYSSMVHYVRY